MSVVDFSPQEGKQRLAFDQKVDVMIYGGSAGSGKSRLLLIKALKFAYKDPNFEGVLFRRTTNPLKAAGGLFSESKKLFSPLKPKVREKDMEILFQATGGGNLKYTHLEHENDAEGNHQGLQYSFCGFDELTHFTQPQFLYLIGRLRSAAEGDSFCMATTNPDCDSWVLNWVEWYLDDKGYPDPEKCGAIRYFLIVDDKPVFANTAEQLAEDYPDLCYQEDNEGNQVYVPPLTFSFIGGTIFDNPALIRQNPKYLAALKAQTKVNRARLLDGCWYAKPEGSNFFQREWLHKAREVPQGAVCVRAWDKAYEEPSDKNRYPDYTASIKMYKDRNGEYFIVSDHLKHLKDDNTDICGRFRRRFGQRNLWMVEQCRYDTEECGDENYSVVLPKEGGAGSAEYTQLVSLITQEGFRVVGESAGNQKGGKLKRFSLFSSAAQNGIVHIVEGSFPNKATLEAFYKELENFDGSPSTATVKDDWVDATSDCFNALQKRKAYNCAGLVGSNRMQSAPPNLLQQSQQRSGQNIDLVKRLDSYRGIVSRPPTSKW